LRTHRAIAVEKNFGKIATTVFLPHPTFALAINAKFHYREGMDLSFEKKIVPVTQEHPLGCAVACVAALFQIRYSEALLLFENEECAWTRGYYCTEIVRALAAAGLEYRFQRFDVSRHRSHLNRAGTIAFVAPSEKYPVGHYFLKTKNGWMNPWINYPHINPAKSGFEKSLPSRVSYIVYPIE
jgi:hypothetical protein